MKKVKVEIPMTAASCKECGAPSPTEWKVVNLGSFCIEVLVCKPCKVKKN